MADAKAFQFAITGVDDSAEAWASIDKRAKKSAAGLAGSAKKTATSAKASAGHTRSAFEAITAPARALSPQVDRAVRALEKMGKVSQSLRASFGPSRVSPFRGEAAGLARTAAVRGATGTVVVEGAAAAEGAVAEGAVAGEAAAGIGGLVTGLVALPIAAAAAVIGIAMMVDKFASAAAKSGQEIGRTASLIGVDVATLQRWRGISERAGLGPEAGTTALSNITQTAHDAQYGQGDPSKMAVLGMLGVKLPGRGEAIDPDAILKQISDKLAAMKDPLSRAHAARVLGVDPVLPVIARGSAAIAADEASYDRTGAGISKGQADFSDRYARAEVDRNQSASGALNRFKFPAMRTNLPVIEGEARVAQGKMPDTKIPALQLPDLRPMLTELGGAATGAAREVGHMAAEAGHMAAAAGRFVGALLQPTAAMAATLAAAAQKHGVSADTLTDVVRHESNFNPSAHAKTSSAAGLGQFTDQTWLGTLKKHGAEDGLQNVADEIERVGNRFVVRKPPAERARIMAMKLDPKLNADMTAGLMSDNAKLMRGSLGRDASNGELYMAHFLGASGAARFARAREQRPDADASALFPDAAKSNKSIFYGKDGGHRSIEDVFERLTADIGKPANGTVDVNVNVRGGGQVVAKSKGEGVKLKVVTAMAPG
jgi:hypothetical protein